MYIQLSGISPLQWRWKVENSASNECDKGQVTRRNCEDDECSLKKNEPEFAKLRFSLRRIIIDGIKYVTEGAAAVEQRGETVWEAKSKHFDE